MKERVKKIIRKKIDPARIRSWNLLIRSQTRYPLRHEPMLDKEGARSPRSMRKTFVCDRHTDTQTDRHTHTQRNDIGLCALVERSRALCVDDGLLMLKSQRKQGSKQVDGDTC